jgi:FAD/FMN-containing dehydrogenase
MREWQVATLTAGSTMLTEAEITDLRASLQGELILPEDPTYEAARRVWNANIDKQPALIARCGGVTDVRQAVNFARSHHLLVSVRGGGHSFPGTCIAANGLVIDLTDMHSVRVDPVRRTVRAEGGTKWGDFDRETQAFGLATTGGTNYDTGIGGLTLGGGMGWLGGKHGLACDNLLAVDIVTADGQLRTASTAENADLFWAVRGGGGNFGVVTSFEYQLYPVDDLLAGLILYPLAQAKDVLRFYHEYASSAPDALNTACGLLNLPDGTPAVAIGVCYNGALTEGEKAMRPFGALGTPLDDHIAPMPYLAVQHLLDNATPEGNQYYEKGHFMQDIPAGAIEVMIEYFRKAPSPLSVPVFQQLGNAANRVAPDATAFGHRDARYNLILLTDWTAPRDTEVNVTWTRELWEALRPYATGGVYVNNIGQEADGDGALFRAAYGVNYQRLAAIKCTYDAANLFRHNQNIKPARAPLGEGGEATHKGGMR